VSAAAALAPLALALAVAAGDGAERGAPPEGTDAANAARAKAGLLPRKRPARAAAPVRAPAPTVVPAVAPAAAPGPAPAAPVVIPVAAAAPEPRGWLRVMVDAARALTAAGEPAERARPSAAIEDVRARAMGLRVEGRLSVRVGGVTMGAASSSGEAQVASPALGVGAAPAAPAVATQPTPAVQ
jgi:hypothetical protein